MPSRARTVLRPGAVLDHAVRHVTAVGVAGIVAGILVGGLGGRLFMRIAAAAAPAATGATTEAGFTVGEITLGGTLGLVIFLGIFVGLAGSFFLVVFRPWIWWAGAWSGLLFGGLLLAAASATSDVLNPDNPDFVILGNGPLVLLMIVCLFVAFGAVHVALYRRLDLRLPPVGRSAWFRTAYYATTAVGLLVAIGLVPQILFGGGTCDCDPPVVAGWFVVSTAVGTALWWSAAGEGAVRAASRWLGFGGLAGTAVFGLARVVSDALDVLA